MHRCVLCTFLPVLRHAQRSLAKLAETHSAELHSIHVHPHSALQATNPLLFADSGPIHPSSLACHPVCCLTSFASWWLAPWHQVCWSPLHSLLSAILVAASYAQPHAAILGSLRLARFAAMVGLSQCWHLRLLDLSGHLLRQRCYATAVAPRKRCFGGTLLTRPHAMTAALCCGRHRLCWTPTAVSQTCHSRAVRQMTCSLAVQSRLWQLAGLAVGLRWRAAHSPRHHMLSAGLHTCLALMVITLATAQTQRCKTLSECISLSSPIVLLQEADAASACEAICTPRQ